MAAKRTIAAASRDLQAAANRLALMTRDQNRDAILAGLYQGTAKGDAAKARLEAAAAPLRDQEGLVRSLRLEVGGLLETLVPERPGLPDFDFAADEPPTKRRKRK